MHKADELLRETKLPVRQVSEAMGVDLHNHFTALFKRKTGASPSVYRS